MSLKWTRQMYIPKNSVQVTTDGTDLEIWIDDSSRNPSAITFRGKAQNPLWHYSFGSVGQRADRIRETIKSRKSQIKDKAKRQAERKAFRHTLAVGDILSGTWGYDQTNVDYYEVVKAKGKTVDIRPIDLMIVDSNDCGQDFVKAVRGSYTGEAMTKRPGEGNSIRIESFLYVHPWNGRAQYQTALGWGH